MEKVFEVKARNKKEALKKAAEKFVDKNNKIVEKDNLEVKLKKKKRRFLGFGSKNIYAIFLQDLNDSEIENKARQLSEDVSIDGQIETKIIDEGVMVKITSPEGNGQRVHYQQMKELLAEKEIVEVDWQAVKEAIENAESSWIKIAPRKPELDKDAKMEIEISSAKMKAFLDYTPALGGKRLTFVDLENALQETGIKYGLKEEKLRSIIETKKPVEGLLIAEGKPPEQGKDAEYVFHFDQQKESIGTKREDGSMDYYDLGLINNVQPGDVLLTIREAEPGVKGISVTGEEILPQKPKDKKLPSGKNVEAKDEKTLVASTAGQVVKKGNKISVLPVYKVKGNVDLSTGNIDFVGNVVVMGDVKEGFSVVAEGNIEIRGNVNASKIKSGGKVVVHKGFVGKSKGKIEAKDDVKIKFVENGLVKSKKNIIILEAVMHSELIAGSKIIVNKKKGLIVGGKCRAASIIEANIIGSSFATETELEAGINPESRIRLKELEETMKKDNQNILKTEKALKLLNKLKKNSMLTDEKKELLHQLKETKESLYLKYKKNQQKFEQLQEKIEKLQQGKILANVKVFPGTKLTIGNCQFIVHDQLSRTAFIADSGEIKQVSI